MCSNWKIISLSIIILFTFPQKVNAAFNFNISSPSATLINSGAQEIEVFLNITELPSESYFRLSLQKESGGSYYGYVQNNNNEWAKIQTLSGDCTSYFKITDLKTSLVILKYKIGDDLSLDNGNYFLKAHKFTKTCSSYTDGLNAISVTVSLPTPTPSPTPINTPTEAPTANPTVKPTPTYSSTPKPTLKPTSTPTPTPNVLEPQVLSLSTTVSSPITQINTNKKSPVLAVVLISLGIGFLGYGGYLLYNMRNANKEIS